MPPKKQNNPAALRDNPLIKAVGIMLDTFNNPLPGETQEQMLVRALLRVTPPKNKA